MNDPDGEIFYKALTAVAIVVIGFLGGVSRLLVSEDTWSWRKFIGLGIIGATLTISVFSVLQFFPDTPNIALIGYSGAIATIGADPVRKLLMRLFSKWIKHV